MYVWGSYSFESGTKQDRSPPLRFPVRAPFRNLAGSGGDLFCDDELLAKGKGGVVSLASGMKHVVMVAGDRLIGFGCNQANQLGDKVASYVDTARVLPFSGRSAPVEVACGRKHTLVRTKDGLVYAAGDNTTGQLGHKLKGVSDFAELQLGGIVQIAASENSSFALSDKGAVYSWGYAGSGHLCHGDRGEVANPESSKDLSTVVNVLTPKLVRWFSDKRVKVVEIAVGKEHVVMRSETDVYTCGVGSFGKLGTNDIDPIVFPHRLTFPQRRTTETLCGVAAGDHHTLILRQSGEVGSVIYVCGRVRGDVSYSTPTLVESPNNICRVLCGANTAMAALSSSGELFVWGEYTPLWSGAPAGASKIVPSQVRALGEFFVTNVTISGCTFVALVDDTQSARDPPGTSAAEDVDPLALYHHNFDTCVSFADRGTAGVDRLEDASLAFYRQWLGDDTGAAYAGSVKKPELVAAVRPNINKRGAHALSVGDKIRLWMTDVYALAIVGEMPLMDRNITATPPLHPSQPPGSSSSLNNTQILEPVTNSNNSEPHLPGNLSQDEAQPTSCVKGPARLYVEWVRDDWVPEICELWSDDETLDEGNPNRWQGLWFVGAPKDTNL